MRIKEVVMEDGIVIEGKRVTNMDIELNGIFYPSCFSILYPTKPTFEYSFYHDMEQRKTICTITINRDQRFGVARCHPNDKFDKAIGCKVALTKALEGVLKDTRKFIWEDYWKKNKDPK